MPMHAVWVWGLIALVAALIALVLFFVRLRTLSARVGAFECALAVKSGWMGGIAQMRSETLDWYRIVSASPSPRLRIERRFVELGQPRRRVNGGTVVEVTLTYGQTEYELAMAEEFHSALVAWADSAAPRAEGFV